MNLFRTLVYFPRTGRVIPRFALKIGVERNLARSNVGDDFRLSAGFRIHFFCQNHVKCQRSDAREELFHVVAALC